MILLAAASRPASRPLHYAMLIAGLVVLGVFLLWPISLTVVSAFEDAEGNWTLEHVAGVMQDPVLQTSLLNSVLVAVCVTALCLLIALPLAVIASHYSFPGKRFCEMSVLVPLVLPPFVGAIGLRHILGRFGALNTLLMDAGLVSADSPIDFMGGARFFSVVLMEALHLYPIIYLNVAAALGNIDPTLDQAAANLGAGLFTRLRRVVLPMALPGIFAGSTIVLIWSFTELGTPLMFEYYQVAPVRIFWGILELESNPAPFALVVVMLVVSVILYTIGKVVLGRRVGTVTTRAMTTTAYRRLSKKGVAGALLLFGGVTAAALLPHLGVVLTALTEPGMWYRSALPTDWTAGHLATALQHPLTTGSIRNSLVYATGAMCLDIVLGVLVAYIVVRARPRGAGLLDALAMLPLAVPGLVLAFGYVAMTLHAPFPQLHAWFNERGWPGADLFQVTGQSPNPLMFLVIAYAVRRLPYVVRSAAAGLEQTPPELFDAAANLGAKRTYTARRVMLPLIMGNLIAGGILAFGFAMLEVSDSLILAQKDQFYPITKTIYTLYTRLGDGPYLASAMGTWCIVLMIALLAAVSSLLGKRFSSVFRL